MNSLQQDLPCWLVEIAFEGQGIYRCKVFAETDDRALLLATQDARMGNPWGQFSGKITSHSTTRLEAETTN